MVVEIHFNFTIHHNGNFEWNPGLEYLGGKVSVMDNVDPDLLIVVDQPWEMNDEDDDINCELHAEWPTNEIILYVEPEAEPIAIKEPMVEPDQPIVVDQPWEMNDEDDDINCEEMTLVVSEHSRGNDNIVSFRSSVVDQNDVSEESVKGLRDSSVGGAMDDNARSRQPIGCG